MPFESKVIRFLEAQYPQLGESLLGYVRWENFTVALHRAIDSCKTQGVNEEDHFREVTKMIEIGKGGSVLFRIICSLVTRAI